MKYIRFYTITLCMVIPHLGLAQPASDTVAIHKLLGKAKKVLYLNPDSAFHYTTQAEKLSAKPGYQKFLAEVYLLKGDYYKNREEYDKATEQYVKALKIEDLNRNLPKIALLYDRLGTIYYIVEKFHKSMEYYKNALDMYLKLNDSLYIAMAYSHIGSLHSSREFCENRSLPQKRSDFNLAIEYYKKSANILNNINAKSELSKEYLNLASVYNKFQMPEKALDYILKAMDYFRSQNDSVSITDANYTLGMTYRRLKQFEKSLDCFRQCIAFGKAHNYNEGIQFVYEAMAQTYEDAGDFRSSLNNYKIYMYIRDSTYSIERSKHIFDLEAKYQSEKKENQILTLTFEKERKQLIVYVLIGAVIIIALGGAFFIHHTRSRAIIAEQNNKISEQKIKELEKERQLIATHAVLHGEETERTRLARDLHDGLGGLLSGLKLSLNNIKGNIFLSENNVDQFNKALGLLDVSMRELRRVAHNMMPEALTKFGLKEALHDFCSSIDNSKTEVKLRFYGEEKRIDQKLEISLYRIVQELINNALKHANATEIAVLIVQEEQRIHLTVQDNGKGFDTEALKTSKGAGLPNIRSRVESLNGHLDVYSKPDKGTEISVEFKWNI
jgi:signal transduction histidine kinase